jgi:hypothetical protein
MPNRMIGNRLLTAAERQRRHRALYPRPEAIRRREMAMAKIAALPAVPRSTVPESRLRNLEYDLLLRRAFYSERAPLAEGLHKIADAVIAGLRAFAERDGPAIAEELEQPPAALMPLLATHLAAQIVEFGDLHGEVDKALNTAAARWKRFPPERGEDGPEIPEWDPPANAFEAQRRQQAATGALEDIKLKVRAGLLLADWPARKATADLLIAWRLQCLEWFAVRACAPILAALRLAVTTDNQWRFSPWFSGRCGRC